MVTFYFIWIIRIRLKGNDIQIQKYPNIRPDWTPKSGSCTPLVDRADQSYFFRPRLHSCSKIFESGSGDFFLFENPSPVQTTDSGNSHRSNRNLPMFYLRNDHTDSCYWRNWKVTPDPGQVFLKPLTPGPTEKRRILQDSTPAFQIRYHLWPRVDSSRILYCFLNLDLERKVFEKTDPNPESLVIFGSSVAASGPTIWTSTYGLQPVLRNRLLIEPSGWAQTVHMFFT